jgi:hypothetical protein
MCLLYPPQVGLSLQSLQEATQAVGCTRWVHLYVLFDSKFKVRMLLVMPLSCAGQLLLCADSIVACDVYIQMSKDVSNAIRRVKLS